MKAPRPFYAFLISNPRLFKEETPDEISRTDPTGCHGPDTLDRHHCRHGVRGRSAVVRERSFGKLKCSMLRRVSVEPSAAASLGSFPSSLFG